MLLFKFLLKMGRIVLPLWKNVSSNLLSPIGSISSAKFIVLPATGGAL